MALPDYTPRSIVYHDISCYREGLLPSHICELVASIDRQTLPARIIEERSEAFLQVMSQEMLQMKARFISEGRLSDSLVADNLDCILLDIVSSVRRIRHQLQKSSTLHEPPNLTDSIMLLVETSLKTALPYSFVLQDTPFAISRPPNASSDPLARFLPYYSKGTFAFVPLGLAGEGEEDMDVDTDSSTGSDGWGRPFPFVVDSYPVEQPSHAVRLPPNYRGFLGEWLDVYEGPRDCDEDYEGPRDHAEDVEYMDSQNYRSPDDTSDTHESNDMNEAPESELLAQHDIDKLCILVFGTRNRIARSFSSALYHRRVRGILGPVLGLVLTPGSPLVQIAIAWLGEAAGGNLPTVHIAWNMDESLKVCSQCVTYDLDDVESALLFGAMILSLKDNLDSETESARAGASSMVAGDLAWRADRVTPPDERDAYEDDSLISTWVVGVRPRPSRERDRHSGGPTMSASKTKHAASSRASQSEKSARGSSGVASEGASSPPVTDSKVDQVRSTYDSRNPRTYSKLAEEAGSSLEPEPFWLWLRDRHVFTGTLPPPWIRRALAQMSDSKDEARLLFEKQTPKKIARVEDYYNYIQLSSSDFSLNISSHPDTRLEPLRQELQAFVRSLPAPQLDSAENDGLRDKLTLLLTRHSFDILRIVWNARNAKVEAETVVVPEAQFRRYFDLLLEIAFDNFEYEASVAILYEKHMSMPRNEFCHMVDQVSQGTTAPLGRTGAAKLRETLGEILHSPASEHIRILNAESDIYTEISGHPGLSDIPPKDAANLATFAGSAADRFWSQVELDRVVTASSVDIEKLRARGSTDPVLGICDAVGVLKVANVFPEVDKHAKTFSILPVPVPLQKPTDSPVPVDDTQDIRQIGLRRGPTAKSKAANAETTEMFATARSARKCNILGQVSITAAVLNDAGGSNEPNETPSESTSIPAGREPPVRAQARKAARVKSTLCNEVVKENEAAAGPMDARRSADRPASATSAVEHTGSETGLELPESRKVEPPDFDTKANPNDFYVPYAALEHNEVHSGSEVQVSRRKGENQLRGYLTAMLALLRNLGVVNFLVFGMVTEGTVVIVTCAWVEELRRESESDEIVYMTQIMERNAFSFDISDPRDALNFVVFLFRLSRLHAPKLRKVIEKSCERIKSGELDPEELSKWTQEYFIHGREHRRRK